MRNEMWEQGCRITPVDERGADPDHHVQAQAAVVDTCTFECTATPLPPPRTLEPKRQGGGRHENMRQWTEEEDDRLRHYVGQHGPRWEKIARLYGDGRTGPSVRNRWMRLAKGRTRVASNSCRLCGKPKRAGHPCLRADAAAAAALARLAVDAPAPAPRFLSAGVPAPAPAPLMAPFTLTPLTSPVTVCAATCDTFDYLVPASPPRD